MLGHQLLAPNGSLRSVTPIWRQVLLALLEVCATITKLRVQIVQRLSQALIRLARSASRTRAGILIATTGGIVSNQTPGCPVKA